MTHDTDRDLCLHDARVETGPGARGHTLICEAVRGHEGPHVGIYPLRATDGLFTPGDTLFWGRGLKAAS